MRTVPPADVKSAEAPRGLTPRAGAGRRPRPAAAVHAQMTAWRVLEGTIMRTAGSSAAASGQRLERIWRDSTMALSHRNTIVQDFIGQAYGAAALTEEETIR